MLTKNIFFVNIINVERQGAYMKRFYKINELRVIEIGFNNVNNVWYADLIDLSINDKISTISNTQKSKVVADIVKENWFTNNIINFSKFIDDVIAL